MQVVYLHDVPAPELVVDFLLPRALDIFQLVPLDDGVVEREGHARDVEDLGEGQGPRRPAIDEGGERREDGYSVRDLRKIDDIALRKGQYRLVEDLD